MRSRLGIRSCYSLLYGVRTAQDIVGRAVSYGASSLAVTDINNLYGVHTILEASKEVGIKAIIGVELTCGKAGGVIAFVRDRPGFMRLSELLTLRKKQASAFDLTSALKEDATGLILASASTEYLASLSGRVPSLYAAVTPRSLHAIPASRKLGLKLIALDDATFLDTDDVAVHAVLRAIACGKTIGNLDKAECSSPEAFFLPPEDFERRLASWPEALQAANQVADECAFDTIFNGFVFPGYETAGEGTPQDLLRRRVLAGAEKRYGELSDAIMGRIDYELDIIGKKGFAPYFLVMDDIVAMASRICGRGSGAASIVSYSLGITNVDPIAHNLYFERFLNMARPDPPDIDVDFAWDERDDLIERVISRFGPDHCGRVANHNMFRPRSALRETARAYGLSDAEISRIERGLFVHADGADMVDPVWTEILAIAQRLEGLPRGLSMHCGGLVITEDLISHHVPVEASAEGFPLIAWEKEGTEAAGLVKIDLLGNRSLAVIRDALANLEEEGIHIDPFLWHPADDADTIAALARGDSMGVFYIESPAMRQLQKKTGHGDFAHIVIHSSIIRPAANKFITEYVRRLKGGAWDPLHPRLAYILDETYGILCYQEDVSKTAVALAGFSEADADKLRKVIAKKAGPAKLAEYEDRFRAGCSANGVDEKTVNAVWEMMLSFDGYSFCKPHSASYAMVSFQSAYLRVHHPAAFIAAVLTNQGGYYRPQAYISEARRMGLTVIGPDINRSRYHYYGEGCAVVVGLMAIANLSRSGTVGLITERERHGRFISLPDIVQRIKISRDDIISLTTAGVFDSVSPGLSRALQARFLLSAADTSTRGSSAQGTLFPTPQPSEATALRGQAAGFGTLTIERPRAINGALQASARRTENELRGEYASLGFLRDRHPLSLYAPVLSDIRRIKAIELPDFIGRKVVLVGWPVTQKEVWTVNGLTMDFVSFEDETALYETVLFPKVYETHRTLLFDQHPLLVLGTVTEDQGAINVEVERLRLLQRAQTQYSA